MEEERKKVMPYALEAEQSVLGCILLDRDCIISTIDIITPDDFYRSSHKDIYSVMLELYKKGEPIGLITVISELKNKNLIERVGGATYITDLTSVPDNTSYITTYAKIVREKSLLRNLIKAAQDIISKSYDNGEDLENILSYSEKAIFDVFQSQRQNSLIEIDKVIMESLNIMEKLQKNKGSLTGVGSGFTDLDRKTNGFQKTDLILIAARPSMGKTALALNLALNAAVKYQSSVALFTLEMSDTQIAMRMIASGAKVPLSNIKNGTLSSEEWDKVTQTMSVLSSQKIYIDDSGVLDIVKLSSVCRRLKIEKGLDMVIIDYLQLMESTGKSENRQQEISKISIGLKQLAKELDCPIIALSQLSRAPEQRSEHRPMLSDLRESGAIEQDADIVMFLYRDEVYNKDTEKKNEAEIIIAKHRNGETGTVELVWFGQYQLFSDSERSPEEY